MTQSVGVAGRHPTAPEGRGKTTMAAVTTKDFGTPDELRTPPKSAIAVLDLQGVKVARLMLEPGWRWSECVKPVAGTETCEVRHLGVMASGSLRVVGADGSESE